MQFQTMLLAIFGVMAVVALVMFGYFPSKETQLQKSGIGGTVTIWGTFPSLNNGVIQMIKDYNQLHKEEFVSIAYEFHDPKTFDQEIVEALASGRGPDVLLLPDDLIVRHSDKIELFPHASMPPAQFMSYFIQAGEIYIKDNGYLALPFAIDPMVLYWNRDLFNNASITQPPVYWDELLTMTPKLTKRNTKTGEVTQSAVAFGEYVNLEHAKDVLAMLFLQVGNPIVSYQRDGSLLPMVAKQNQRDVVKYVASEDVTSALRFFMDFSNPLKQNYTWNRARGNSLDEFINGDLAIHFDYASAMKKIETKSPHLNFSVAPMPIPRGTSAELTYGKVYGLAVMKSSRNIPTAFYAVAKLLTDPTPAKNFSAAFDLPPVRRDLLATKPTNAELSIFYDAAIRVRVWLDPRPLPTDAAFQRMVESVASGRNDAAEAIVEFNEELKEIIKPGGPTGGFPSGSDAGAPGG